MAIFQDPNHEYCRLLVASDTTKEQLLAVQGAHLPTIDIYCKENQLDGVLPFRVIEMDLPCPIRSELESFVVELAKSRDRYLADVSPIIDALESAGIPYVTSGYATEYVLLGMSPNYWPRDFNHIHIIYHDLKNTRADILEVMRQSGYQETLPQISRNHPLYTGPNGTRFVIGNYNSQYNRCLDAFTNREKINIYGKEMSVFSNEYNLCNALESLYQDFVTESPLTPYGMGVLHNLIVTKPTFDWDKVMSWFRVGKDEYDPYLSISTPKKVVVDNPIGASYACQILFIIQIVEKIYPGTIPLGILSTMQTELNNSTPYLWKRKQDIEEVISNDVYEWVANPKEIDTEDLIFGTRYSPDVNTKLSKGLITKKGVVK